jgi:hypothetical protein
MRRLHLPVVLLCFCLVVLLGACGQDPEHDPSRDVPRVFPDTSPGKLYIAVFVTALENPAASEGTTGTEIAVQFFHKTDHYLVKFIHGESWECNQVTVPADLPVLHLPQVLPAGTPIVCHYTGYSARLQKSVATVTVRVPALPRISTPQPGAKVPRDQPIVVAFDQVSGSVEAISGPEETNRAWQQYPRSGQSAALDGHLLTPGPGKICVISSISPEFPVEGRSTGFDSAIVNPSSESCVPVIWT